MKDDSGIGHERWLCLACIIGYNELAKQGKTLGEKVYFMVFRDEYERKLVELGGQVSMDRDPPVLTIGEAMPYIRFSAKDIELMREAVRKHDEVTTETNNNMMQPGIADPEAC